ncbi:hypothetical protein EGJ00_06745 [Pseudomonas saudiphocaensis]|nr:hypothetical protein EGJ00_06745 [Pseudomonas saudiphocaensis]
MSGFQQKECRALSQSPWQKARQGPCLLLFALIHVRQGKPGAGSAVGWMSLFTSTTASSQRIVIA